jgi:hypothetical protein
MKKLSLALILISCTALTACNNGQKINAHNEKTAFKSVRTIKNRLNEDMRLSYELSFWMIRDFKRNDDEFLKKQSMAKSQQKSLLWVKIFINNAKNQAQQSIKNINHGKK